MIFILHHVVDDCICVANDIHIETEKEFEGRILTCCGEEGLDSRGGPGILSDVHGETVDVGQLRGLDVHGEGFGGVRVRVAHHKVAEDILISVALRF